jgi:hypothetical protein
MPERILQHLFKPFIGLILGAFVDISSRMLGGKNRCCSNGCDSEE